MSKNVPLRQRGSQLHALWYRSLRILVRFLLFLLTDYKVSGQENVPADGPLMITTNHVSAVDLPAVMPAIPHEVAVFAADKHRIGLRGLIMRTVHVIFVRRGTADRKALRQARDILEMGGILGVAPEGTRSSAKTLIRGKPGAAFLAVRADATILPIGITGTEKVFSAWRRWRRPRIRVVIGEPYKLEAPAEGRPDFHALSEEMMLRIAQLLPPQYRGVYADWSEDRRPKPLKHMTHTQSTEPGQNASEGS